MSETEKAKKFFQEYTGEHPLRFEVLAQSGSERINFFASTSHQNFIVTYNSNLDENESFFYFSELFSGLDLNTPNIYSISEDRMIYVQEYLGAHTLSDLIAAEGLSESIKSLVQKTLERLYKLQTKTEGKTDFKKTFEYEKYDELPIIHDLFYFKNFMADVLEIHYHKSALLKEFKKLISKVEALEPKGLMIRDFQSRNIMVNENSEVFFIDYQAAMEGPLMYDVISFLYQAKAGFPEDFKNEMLHFYCSLWQNEEMERRLKQSVKPIQLMRFLQVLGAYGFRGLVQKKAHFVASIHKGIENLVQFSQTWEEMDDFPELKKVITALSSSVTKEKIEAILNKS